MPDTCSLVALVRQTSTTAKVHKKEWEKIVNPLCVSVWERKLSNHLYMEFPPTTYAMVSEKDSERILTRCRRAAGSMRSIVDQL